MNTKHDFRTYWLRLSMAERKEFCRRVGASYSNLNQHSSVGRPLSAELALVIERETGGAVRFEAIRPDIDISHRLFTGEAA